MRRFRFALPLLLLSIGASSALSAQGAGLALAQRFGALESVQQISVSPDGTKLAIVGPRPEGGENVYVADLVAGGPPKPILISSRAGEWLNWCNWTTNTRLVCGVRIQRDDGIQLIGFSRLFSLNADGSDVKLLSADGNGRTRYIVQSGGGIIDWDVPGKPGSVLMTRQYVPEETIGTLLANDRQGFGVDVVDTVSVRRTSVERPSRTAVEYISDGHGTVRIMATQQMLVDTQMSPERRYFYRLQGSRDWKPLSVVSNETYGQGFDPYAVDHLKNVAYGFENVGGFRALHSMALDGSGTKQVVLARNDVDIDELIRIGRDDRVVGASYATERRTVEYFDPELKRLSTALARALPGQPAVGIIDADAGENKLLLLASSDTSPGMFYLYDKVTRQLEEVLPVRNELSGITLGTMKPITFPAADGTQIPGYLTLPPGSDGKNLPTIVMPHGGPGSRDEWGFDWLVQYFAVRGFAVLQPNFRGSAGYGSAWYQKNGFQSWRIAIGDVNDAGRWLNAQGIAAPGKLGILGWSYGGYAALQSAVLDPDLFKAIVAIAPVTDLDRLRQESVGFTNARLVSRFIGTGAHVTEGSPAQNAGRIKVPVLMFHGDRDENVGIAQSRLMADRLRGAGKPVELIEFPGLDHYLRTAAARSRMLATSDAFLRRSMGMPAN
jgi:dipeptidyl aminopeptidase/acylaminoacyl peptidase